MKTVLRRQGAEMAWFRYFLRFIESVSSKALHDITTDDMRHLCKACSDSCKDHLILAIFMPTDGISADPIQGLKIKCFVLNLIPPYAIKKFLITMT